MNTSLPIDAALPPLLDALRRQGRAVLQAPPGTGKTTRVPLALMREGLAAGRIVMLEPRRLAARAAAERMAETLGEPLGRTVGYRIRGEARVSAATRIEVVTEGILTRMIQRDPGLEGVGALIFDEFHERSLNADLGLALAWDLRCGLRDDLLLLVMSATLDAAPVAALLDDAPVVTSGGQSFPVETRWLDRPLPPRLGLENATAELTLRALEETGGGILVFLPGEREIRRCEALLRPDLPPGCQLHTLYGAMPARAQRAAIAPAAGGRKIVLATSIAETSLTIEDVRVVIDAGCARRMRFDPGSGMSRLVTERVSRAEADQRRGRAGRVAPGRCYRLWARAEEGALAAFAPAEIETADLSGLALELAEWGAAPETLAFLTPPPGAAFDRARALLSDLGALDHDGRLTPHGKALARLPLHPRLGHMLLAGGRAAAPLAALLAGRDPLRGASADLKRRLAAVSRPQADPDAQRGTVEQIREEERRLAALLPRETPGEKPPYSTAELAALAYPDRIGLRRKGNAARWVLSGGKGATMAEGDPLAAARLLVATDLDGDRREARIRQAIEIDETALRALFADAIVWRDVCRWSRRERRVEARQQEMLGALVLADRPWPDAPPEALARAALDGLRDLGLDAAGFSAAARRLQARVALVRAGGGDLPDMSDTALLEGAESWLLPHLANCRSAADLAGLDLTGPMQGMLSWEQNALLDRLAPAHYLSPLGNRIPIDYSGDLPEVALRLQEVFGLREHPTVGPQHLPLRLVLLSPARRPVQTTTDLPGFWASSYADVRKEMRGRYPRHPWPEDPREAAPTLRAKPRGS